MGELGGNKKPLSSIGLKGLQKGKIESLPPMKGLVDNNLPPFSFK